MLKKVIAFFFLLLVITGMAFTETMLCSGDGSIDDSFLLLFSTATAFTETILYSGDDKIDEIQKRIDEEKARQKKEKEKDDGDESSCLSGLFEGCLEGLFEGCLEGLFEDCLEGLFEGCLGGLCNSDSDRRDSDRGSGGNDIVRCKNAGNVNNKWGFMTASLAGSYLFENTMSLTTLLEAYFFMVHVNGFYQYTMAESKTMNIFSINGGISIPLQSALLDFFCGFFYYDYIGNAIFSFGASTKIRLPANLYLDIYNANAFFGSLGFHILNASLNLALRRFAVGAGYRFHSYAGVIFHGPELKLSVWI